MSDPTPAPTDSLDDLLARLDKYARRENDDLFAEASAALAAERERADRAEAKFEREQAMHAATRRHWEGRGVNLVDKAAEVDRLRARLDALTEGVKAADRKFRTHDISGAGNRMFRQDVRALLDEGDTDGP